MIPRLTANVCNKERLLSMEDLLIEKIEITLMFWCYMALISDC